MTTPRVILARDIRAAEGGSERLTRAARRGELTRVARGVYAATAAWQAVSPEARHRALAAVLAPGPPGSGFSHETAAALHGIPFVGDWPDRLCSTVAPGSGDSSGVMRRTRLSLDGDDLTTVDGIPVTTSVRTAVDLAMRRSLLAGIVAVSHVRHLGVTRDAIDAAITARGAAAGVRRARIALARSSAQSESPLESLVLARCEDLGFVPPAQQTEVIGLDGRAYRCDFSWCDGQIIVEADGRGKYRDATMLAGRTPDEVLWAEKRREDAIRPTRRAFIRIGWTDAYRGTELERRLAAVGVPRPGRRRPLTF